MAPEQATNERERLQSQIRFHRAANAGLLTVLLLLVLLLVCPPLFPPRW